MSISIQETIYDEQVMFDIGQSLIQDQEQDQEQERLETIDAIKQLIQINEERISNLNCQIITTHSKKRKLVFEKTIEVYKLQICLCKSILKNNKQLYPLFIPKIQEKLTEILEIINDSVAFGVLPEECYLSLCKSLMSKFDKIKLLIQLCKNIHL